jgi:hypothetical protein
LQRRLAVAGDRPAPTAVSAADAAMSVLEGVALCDRAATLAEFEDFLRTTNNRDFEEGTINAYVRPGKNLDTWLTANGIAVDISVRRVPASTPPGKTRLTMPLSRDSMTWPGSWKPAFHWSAPDNAKYWEIAVLVALGIYWIAVAILSKKAAMAEQQSKSRWAGSTLLP